MSYEHGGPAGACLRPELVCAGQGQHDADQPWADGCNAGLGVLRICLSCLCCAAGLAGFCLCQPAFVTGTFLLQIRQAFDFAYQQLTAASDAGESLLARILRLDKVLVNRPAPAHPVALEQFEEAAEGAHKRPAKRKHRKGSTSIDKRKKQRRAERDSAFDDVEELVMESSSLEDGAWERSQHSGSSRDKFRKRRRISEEGDSGQQVRKQKARRRLRRRERSQT